MPIKIRCACGNVLLAPEDRVGQTGKCPNCNRSIKVEMPQSSDTKKLASIEKGAKDESSKQFFTLRRKPSWLRRILSLPIYVLFLFLIFFLFSLHFFSEAEIKNFCGLYLSQEIWLQEQILFAKVAHKEYFLQKIYCPISLYYNKIVQKNIEKKEEKSSFKQESPLKEIPKTKKQKEEKKQPEKIKIPFQEENPQKTTSEKEKNLKEEAKKNPDLLQENLLKKEKSLKSLQRK